MKKKRNICIVERFVGFWFTYIYMLSTSGSTRCADALCMILKQT